MATYFELLAASENADLKNRIRVAVIIAAEKIRTEPTGTVNNANRLLWARDTFLNPDVAAQRMVPAVLAKTQVEIPTVTLAQIVGADDATVQAAVDSAVNVFAIGA